MCTGIEKLYPFYDPFVFLIQQKIQDGDAINRAKGIIPPPSFPLILYGKGGIEDTSVDVVFLLNPLNLYHNTLRSKSSDPKRRHSAVAVLR